MLARMNVFKPAQCAGAGGPFTLTGGDRESTTTAYIPIGMYAVVGLLLENSVYYSTNGSWIYVTRAAEYCYYITTL